MLPQSLVQNKLIGTDNGVTFTIDWKKASQIIDTNFYYTWRLVDESYYYRAAQYPYTLISPQPSSDNDLKLHEYYISTHGEYVYCIKVATPNSQIMKWVPGYYQYAYNEQAGKLTLTLEQLPVYIRCARCGLEKSYSFNIYADSRSVSDSEIIFDIINTSYPYATDSSLTSLTESPVLLSTDKIMGRILLVDECIANVPVSIIKTPDSTGLAYNYSLSIPNLNYPQNALLEVY